MYFFLGREVLMMKDNNFELEEAISDILIKTSPFEQAGTVLTATEAYCSFPVEYVNDPNLYQVAFCAKDIIFINTQLCCKSTHYLRCEVF